MFTLINTVRCWFLICVDDEVCGEPEFSDLRIPYAATQSHRSRHLVNQLPTLLYMPCETIQELFYHGQSTVTQQSVTMRHTDVFSPPRKRVKYSRVHFRHEVRECTQNFR